MKLFEPRAARLLLIGSGLYLILLGTLAAQMVPQRKEDSTVELSANQGVFSTDTLRERCAIDYFNAHLNEEDRLTADQKESLMKLLRAQQDADMARRRAESGSRIPLAKTAFSPEAMQKLNVLSNEDNFRQMQEDSCALLRQLPAILTPKQLEAYARMEAEKLASQKKYIQQIRVSAGMSPEFDDTRPREPPAKRIPVVGTVRLEIRLTVNASPPVTADLVTENRKTATAFQGPEGLWVELTPTLYEDGWAQVDFTYYEEWRGHRHRIGRGMSGMLTRRPDGLPNYGGGGRTLGGVSNTYAISTKMKVSAVE